MEKDDIVLPTLPGVFAWAMVDEELAEAAQEYVRTAIFPYKKRIADLESKLEETDAGGMNCNIITPKPSTNDGVSGFTQSHLDSHLDPNEHDAFIIWARDHLGYPGDAKLLIDSDYSRGAVAGWQGAIESDRQRRSEPVGYAHPANEHRLYSGETIAFRQRPYDGEKKIPVYLSPQPTEEVFCQECGDGLAVEYPGICGTCYQTKYVSPQTADPVMAWRVGRELFHTEEEARANVRNPDLNPIPLCDCERGHNGMGMTGRKCDCGAPYPNESVKGPSRDDILKAMTSCKHNIESEKVILHCDGKQKGNALSQAVDRVVTLLSQYVHADEQVKNWPDGTPRDPRDIASDPEGKLIHDPVKPLLADKKARVPRDDDLIALALEIAPHATPDHIHKFSHLWVRLCRLALTRYGHPTTTSASKKGDMRIKGSKLWVCTDPDIDRWACPDGAGWQLVPKELIEFIRAKEHHLPIEDRHALSNMLKAAPKFGENE